MGEREGDGGREGGGRKRGGEEGGEGGREGREGREKGIKGEKGHTPEKYMYMYIQWAMAVQLLQDNMYNGMDVLGETRFS